MSFPQEKSGVSRLPLLQSRFFLPSARDLIFLFLFWSLIAGTLSNRPLADPDIGWHIRNGEQILLTHRIPFTDPFSSTMQGQPWIAWEWLYDLLLGVLHAAGGLNGVVWLSAVVLASIFTLLLSQLLVRGTGILLAVALMLLAEGAATIHLFARPHIVTWLFVLLWFIALERWDREHPPQWLPWFFPLSMVLWVNLHGGWLLGMTLLAIYALAAKIESLVTQDPFAALGLSKRANLMSLTWVASAVATLANPFGWRLHSHIYRYLTDRYLMNRIAEFRPPNFHGWAERCFGLLLLLTLLSVAGRGKRMRLCHFLVLLFVVYSGFLSARSIPVSSMLLVLLIGPILSERFRSLAGDPGTWKPLRAIAGRVREFSARMAAQELEMRGHLWPIVFASLMLVVCLNGGKVGSLNLIHAHFEAKIVPVAAVDFLERQPGNEPVFATDSWGAYLIYRLYPQRLVVVDDRHDLYGSDRIREVLILLQGEPGWKETLEKWHIRLAVLPANSAAANLLRQMPWEWAVIYQDKLAVILRSRLTPAGPPR